MYSRSPPNTSRRTAPSSVEVSTTTRGCACAARFVIEEAATRAAPRINRPCIMGYPLPGREKLASIPGVVTKNGSPTPCFLSLPWPGPRACREPIDRAMVVRRAGAPAGTRARARRGARPRSWQSCPGRSADAHGPHRRHPPAHSQAISQSLKGYSISLSHRHGRQGQRSSPRASARLGGDLRPKRRAKEQVPWIVRRERPALHAR